MQSTRHWNLERHIRIKHEGRGDVIGEMPYVIKTLNNQLPFPTYPSNVHPKRLSNPDLRILDERAEQVYEKRGAVISEIVNEKTGVLKLKSDEFFPFKIQETL